MLWVPLVGGGIERYSFASSMREVESLSQDAQREAAHLESVDGTTQPKPAKVNMSRDSA